MNIQTKITSIIAAGILLVSCGESARDEGLEGPFELSSAIGKPSEEAKGFYGDIVYGDENAPVTIVEYASLTCSHCGAFHNEILPKLKTDFMETGRVKLIFRNYVRDAYDLAAATFARCEDDMEQAKRWHNMFFERQGDWYRQGVQPIDELAGLARKSGVSRAKFDRCAVNPDVQKFLRDVGTEASTKLQVNATPTIYVNGMKLPDYGFETIKKAVERAEK